jgi:hypothetical protein
LLLAKLSREELEDSERGWPLDFGGGVSKVW